MARIYVAGPIIGVQQTQDYDSEITQRNVNGGLIVASRIREMGHVPFVPQLSVYWVRFIQDRNKRAEELVKQGWVDNIGPLVEPTHEDWLDMDIQWIKVCHGMYRIPLPSKGADTEEAYMNTLGRPVFHDLDSLSKWDFGGDDLEVGIIEDWIGEYGLNYRT